MQEEHFDVIIIGAGICGSTTAYRLLQYDKNLKILLLERFDVLHKNGSSHGLSRIIRKTYPENFYTKMMFKAYDLWKEAFKCDEIITGDENSSGVFYQTGGVDFAPKTNKDLKNLIKNCEMYSLNHEVLNAKQLAEKFPAFKIPEDYIAVYQKDAGILNPTKAVNMFLNMAKHFGAKIRDNEEVIDIKMEKENILIRTCKKIISNYGQITGNFQNKKIFKNYSAKKLVIATGMWSKQIIEKFFKISLNLKPIKLTYGYYKPINTDIYNFGKFPIFIDYTNPSHYGFPSLDYSGLVKIAPHFSNEIIHSPNDRNFEPNLELLKGVEDWISRNLLYLEKKPKFTETCVYTMTPDENFILDFLPNTEKRVIIGTGFSGHGFKFGPLLGDILAELTIYGKSSMDLSPFSLSDPKRNLIFQKSKF